MASDKIVVEGMEFSHVVDGYLLQSEVEDALKQRQSPAPHVNRLTALLEDIVTTADSVALQTVEAHTHGKPLQTSDTNRPETRNRDEHSGEAAREMLRRVRQNLREQILVIDAFLQRLED